MPGGSNIRRGADSPMLLMSINNLPGSTHGHHEALATPTKHMSPAHQEQERPQTPAALNSPNSNPSGQALILQGIAPTKVSTALAAIMVYLLLAHQFSSSGFEAPIPKFPIASQYINDYLASPKQWSLGNHAFIRLPQSFSNSGTQPGISWSTRILKYIVIWGLAHPPSNSSLTILLSVYNVYHSCQWPWYPLSFDRPDSMGI